MFSVSHGIDLYSPKAMRRELSVAASRLMSQLAEGRDSGKNKAIVPCAGNYRFIVPERLTNGFSRIYHLMH